jgi:hypothetical protein
MFRSLIVTAALAAGPIAWAASPMLPASPLQSTPPAATAPALTAPQPSSLPTVVAVSPVGTCGSSRASQAPAQASKAADASEAPQAAAAAAPSGGVNLNTATATELEALPGIGAKTAARILALQPRVTLEAVQAMPGMSPAHWAELAPHVTV